ncbi:MAG: hypothetical protein LBB40_01610 [Holophagales bacterium]|nr:hypothetical protein [Holophagales bacterium]
MNQNPIRQTYEYQVLQALKDAYLRLLAMDEVEIQIHHRKVIFRDPAKIEAMIEKYQAIVAAQNGISPITSIPVRFRL